MYRCARRLRGSLLIAALAALVSPLIAGAQTGSLPSPLPRITMAQAVDLALERNQAMRAQRLNVDQSKANETTASLRPNLVFTSLNQGFPVFTPSQLTWDYVANSQTFTQSVSYLFERGGKRDKRILVAQDTTDLSAKTVADVERQLRFQVAQAFIGVLLARSNLDLARDDLKDFSQVVDINKQRMTSGDLAEGDYLKIALQKLQFEQDVSAAEVGLVQGKAALRQLVGYETVTEDFDVIGELAHRKFSVTPEKLQEEALAARPDLQAARANSKLATDTVALAQGNGARDVTGEIEYERFGPVNAMGFFVSFELPIHDRNQGEIARSKVAVTQAQESESSARAGVLTDLVDAYSGFQINDRVVSLYESGYLEQARQSREISNYAYRRGASSLLDLLEAERTYRATQLAYRQALAAYMTGVEQINFVVGRQVMQ
jgi:cobalt-zinc-cadmium efflux system outer membrane protein